MEEKCALLRGEIQDLATQVRDLKDHSLFEGGREGFPGQFGEMKANVMLAYRHLEDARMRLGKVMQPIRGGESIY